MYKKNKELTQNGLFYYAAKNVQNGLPPEKIKVYERLRRNVWCYKGTYDLIDAWIENSNGRKVFKFKLILNTN